MHFKVGDHVIHLNHGLGQIVAIEEKQFGSAEARWFYCITIERSTVWVPVTVEMTPQLRLLVSKKALAGYRNLLRSRPVPLNPDKRQRALDLTNRLRLGSFEVLCEILRDLTAQSWPKPLGSADANVLRKVQDSVFLEWSKAEGVSIVEAAREITEILQESRRLYFTPAPVPTK
jgi:RNA polymerase-interacting CarD/CdnL/TRCF family regulator